MIHATNLEEHVLAPSAAESLRFGLRDAARVLRPPIVLVRRGYLFAKRMIDVTACVAILPVALAVMAFCALLIWLDDPGPILFTQLRTGKGGKRFRMYK